jgi:hypothetical protein
MSLALVQTIDLLHSHSMEFLNTAACTASIQHSRQSLDSYFSIVVAAIAVLFLCRKTLWSLKMDYFSDTAITAAIESKTIASMHFVIIEPIVNEATTMIVVAVNTVAIIRTTIAQQWSFQI